MQRAAEHCHIARRRHLARIGQAGRIAEDRPRHAQRARLGGHPGGEGVFRTADILADGDGDVIGGAGHHRQDRVTDADRLAGLEAELRWRLVRCMGRDRDGRGERGLAAVERLEQQVERHHLGERGRIALPVGIVGVKDVAGLGVDDDRRTLGRLRHRRESHHRHDNRDGGQKRPQPSPGRPLQPCESPVIINFYSTPRRRDSRYSLGRAGPNGHANQNCTLARHVHAGRGFLESTDLERRSNNRVTVPLLPRAGLVVGQYGSEVTNR